MTLNSSEHHLVLVGNYVPDNQTSMARFAEWVDKGLRKSGWKVDVIKPPVVFAKRAKSTLSGIGKWLGYIDKFILFPRRLRTYAKGHPSSVFLVTDHSNAYYARFLPRDATVVTCHDVLAIEGALGDPEAFCPASRTGLYFQKWILRSLQAAPSLAFVSRHTKESYLKLPGKPAKDQKRAVIPNGINQSLNQLDSETSKARIADYDPSILEQPYLLHVGSSLPRKNRTTLMKAFAHWKQNPGQTSPLLILVGKTLSATEQAVADELGINGQMIVLTGVSTELLEALYNRAFAFCFPSFSEGFGWPIIEAQSCGTPVIVGNRSCLPEIAGEGALLCDPYEPISILEQLDALEDNELRSEISKKGLKNIERFSADATLSTYARLFESLLPN